jgi:hypothetical protein
MTLHSHPLSDNTINSQEEALRNKRREKIIDKKIEEIVVAIHQMHEHKDSLSLEVEELKGARAAFKTELQQALKQELGILAPSFSKSLSETFHQETNSFINRHLEELRLIQEETGKTVSSLQSITEQSKRRTILMGISLVMASCFSCFVMAADLFYFFPSHHEVTYQTTQEQFKEMVYGRALMNAFKNLKPDAQALILSALDATLKQMSSGKSLTLKLTRF